MREYNIISIDLAKRSLQVCFTDQHKKIISNTKYSRRQFEELIPKIKAKLFVFEACATAHYWGRKLQSLGHQVCLLDPAYVKPFTNRRQKNDKNDAKAILAAFHQPDQIEVLVKTEEQQVLQMLIRSRQSVMQTKVAEINRIRGMLSEFGLILPKSHKAFRLSVIEWLGKEQEDATRKKLQGIIRRHYGYIIDSEEEIKQLDKQIAAEVRNNACCQHMLSIPGVGQLTALAMYAAIGSGRQFRNGRHLSAYLGLVPSQHSSGERVSLGKMTKSGNVYLRSLLVQGAQSVLNLLGRHATPLHQKAKRLLQQRKPRNITIIAIANTMARWIYAALDRKDQFDPNVLPKPNHL